MIQTTLTKVDETNKEIVKAINQLSIRSVDGTIDKVLKHKLVNTSDSSAIASTNSETAYSTTATLSKTLFKPGRIFRLTASGILSTTGTPTIRFRVRIGTTNIVVFTAQTCPNNSSNQPFLIQAEISVKTIGTSGTVAGEGRLFFGSTTATELVVNATDTTVDTTPEQTLNVTAQWSVADAANTTKIRNFIAELSDY